MLIKANKYVFSNELLAFLQFNGIFRDYLHSYKSFQNAVKEIGTDAFSFDKFPGSKQRLIHINVWQKPSPYCKVISLQIK